MLKFQIDKILKQKEKSLYWLSKETGISYPTLHKIMNNTTVSVSLDILEKLCKALEIDLDELLKAEE